MHAGPAATVGISERSQICEEVEEKFIGFTLKTGGFIRQEYIHFVRELIHGLFDFASTDGFQLFIENFGS